MPRRRKAGPGGRAGGAPSPRGREAARGRSGPPQRRKAPSPGTWTAGPDALVVRGHETNLPLAHYLYESQGRQRLSIRALRRALSAGCCRVNGMIETFGNRKLRKGDIVEFNAPVRDPLDHDFEPARILHDADGIVAYDKPPGLPVVPPGGRRSWCLQRMLEEALGPVHPVHRLDADTSGLVLMARDQATATTIKDCFREHAVEKSYLAVVRGQPQRQGRKRSYLICTERRRGFERWASGKGQGAREAITTWELERRIGRHASLMRVRPLTGRYHQIRIHFAEMGHPLIGDRLYGDRQDPIPITRHLLHADRIELPSADSDRLCIQSPQLPQDLQRALADLAALR
ncbi:MAG: RluA family pseudouridine synthase [Planctomycetota bacterium]